ncbi:MAG: peptidoglycan DD-metalloendopeptidase family protein [Lachnospiraceae bacterium]|nr:peptidoglycan DD-metalloendopeptidase family protein [Lachnospiraceae bacterium]
MPRGRQFQRKKKDVRMPAREAHGGEQEAGRQAAPDFDLRHARAGPVPREDTGSRLQGTGQRRQAGDHSTQAPGRADAGNAADACGMPEAAGDMPGADAREAAAPVREPHDRPLYRGRGRTAAPTREDAAGKGHRRRQAENFREGSRYKEAVQTEAVADDAGWPETGPGGPAGAAPGTEGYGEAAGESPGTDSTGNAGHEEAAHRGRTPQEGERRKRHQDGSRYRRQARQETETGAGGAEGKPEDTGRTSRLEFAPDERPPGMKDRKLERAGKKAERAAEKLEKAQERLPARRKLRMETVSDPDTGKAAKRLKFEKEAKPQGAHVKGPVPLRPVKAGANAATGYAHKKIYQAEEENVGIKAAHRTELAGEAGVRTAWHRHRTAPYRRAARLQQKSARAQAGLAYRQALHDSPQLKKDMLARMWQKQKIKRRYAKAAREAQKAGKRAGKAAAATERIAEQAVMFVKSHPVAFGAAGLLLLVFFLISSLLTSCSNMGSGGLGLLASSTYLAEDADIDRAELAYTEWETDLELEIGRVEEDHPGYDEYRYNIGPVEHDPYVLMGYLTAAFQDFTWGQAEGVLRQLFGEQYTLIFTEETETRYRTETVTDPETGEETEEEVPYEWHILNVELSVIPMENLVSGRMSTDEREICGILMETKGSRQYVGNVFGTDWLPCVTSYYGYRVHPVSGEKNYHTGVDIGMPQGTEILAGHDGRVTLAGDAGGYGLCVAIEGEAYEGHTLTTKYGHCSQLLVSAGQEVRAGDVIAKVGSTGNSTGPHLHLEVLVDGQYLNPLYFADTGNTEGRSLPEAGAAAGGGYTDYDVPPEALADERFAAMLREAEKYLGYPYVWGGSSPSTSFDCSGYVSWVVNHSGWDMGRQTANGLLGSCTPVSAADARPGDLVFFQGTYNTSGASHVGIYVGDGMMIHCGNPISYADINSRYWQQHFYTFGRLP